MDMSWTWSLTFFGRDLVWNLGLSEQSDTCQLTGVDDDDLSTTKLAAAAASAPLAEGDIDVFIGDLSRLSMKTTHC